MSIDWLSCAVVLMIAKLALSFFARIISVFKGIKAAKVFSAYSGIVRRAPVFFVNAVVSSLIVVADLHILQIFRLRTTSKVRPFVIKLVSVNVVNDIRRLIARHHFPNQPMHQKTFSIKMCPPYAIFRASSSFPPIPRIPLLTSNSGRKHFRSSISPC